MSQLEGDRQLAPDARPTADSRCGHDAPVHLRLIDYTRYGTWIGCVRCGSSWLVRVTPSSAPLPR